MQNAYWYESQKQSYIWAKTIYFNDDLFVLMLNQKRNYDLETSARDSIINIVL